MIGTSTGTPRRFARLRRAIKYVVAAVVVLSGAGVWLAEPNAEAYLATEKTDQSEIVKNMLTIQAKFAAEQNRPLARGTHAKGTCALGEFEIHDLRTTVADQALAARLARGPYARPGRYPAVVRFANGQSQIYDDAKPDVRALSFSADLSAAGGTRQDYSMNNATTFPLNDAHVFAAATKLVAADSMAGAFRALPLVDKLAFARLAMLGKMQEKPPARAYQTTRYWSTTPYRHGPQDVIKYSALPCASNTERPLNSGPNALQDELTRHLGADRPTACFDFALQFLDPEQMTRYGMKRSREYWVENASVEWHESQAPFHTVGRLTLTPASVMLPEACNAQHIDVSENSTADTTPVGSINRARWGAEAASRKARTGKGE